VIFRYWLQRRKRNAFFAPTTEVIARFANKKAVLKWLMSRATPLKDFKSLYSEPRMLEFTTTTLPLSDLVLAFSNRESSSPRGQDDFKLN